MVVESIGGLLSFSNKALDLQESDLKFIVERFVKDNLRVGAVRCVAASRVEVVVLSGSPAVRQALYLLEYDLREEFVREVGFEFKDYRVTQ